VIFGPKKKIGQLWTTVSGWWLNQKLPDLKQSPIQPMGLAYIPTFGWFLSSWWLSFNPFEKYARQIGFIFPNFRGENKIIFELPPPRSVVTLFHHRVNFS